MGGLGRRPLESPLKQVPRPRTSRPASTAGSTASLSATRGGEGGGCLFVIDERIAGRGTTLLARPVPVVDEGCVRRFPGRRLG